MEYWKNTVAPAAGLVRADAKPGTLLRGCEGAEGIPGGYLDIAEFGPGAVADPVDLEGEGDVGGGFVRDVDGSVLKTGEEEGLGDSVRFDIVANPDAAASEWDAEAVEALGFYKP